MQHAPISRARYRQENRKMRFQEAYEGWTQGRLRQTVAALLLGSANAVFAVTLNVLRPMAWKDYWTNG